MIFAKNGICAWRIVTKAAAPKLDKRAAEEIKNWLYEAGAKLPVVSDVEPEMDYEILVGGARGVRPLGLLGGAFDEDYAVEIGEKRVVICGSGLRGTLYAALDFLEKDVGVRFFARDTTYVPRKSEISLACGTRYDKPDIGIRRMPFKCASGLDVAPRLRFNEICTSEGLADNPEYGRGDYTYAIGHSIHHMVPDDLFASHPEYFPEIGGKRENGEYHQRCLTNPDVLEMAVAAVTKLLRENPMQTTIAVGQADTYPDAPNNCTCPACRAIDEAEGSPMGTLLRFVNAVAERIEPEFPYVKVNTLAYRYTRKPPKITKPRDNVLIVLCSIECCFSHAIGSGCGADYMDGPIGHVGNAEFVEDIEGWAAISKNLMIWDYVTNFPHYLAPHPNLHCVGDNVRFFRDHHAFGIYPEGAHDCLGAELDEARTYMFSKLLWHCDTDERLDLEEFMIGKLGVAAAPILRAIDMLRDHVVQNNIHMSTYHTPDERTFPRDLVEKASKLFDRAEKTAPDDKALSYVRKLRMSLRYIQIALYEGEKTEVERREIAESFLRDMDECGVEKLMEGGDREKSIARAYKLLRLEA